MLAIFQMVLTYTYIFCQTACTYIFYQDLGWGTRGTCTVRQFSDGVVWKIEHRYKRTSGWQRPCSVGRLSLCRYGPHPQSACAHHATPARRRQASKANPWATTATRRAASRCRAEVRSRPRTSTGSRRRTLAPVYTYKMNRMPPLCSSCDTIDLYTAGAI